MLVRRDAASPPPQHRPMPPSAPTPYIDTPNSRRVPSVRSRSGDVEWNQSRGLFKEKIRGQLSFV